MSWESGPPKPMRQPPPPTAFTRSNELGPTEMEKARSHDSLENLIYKAANTLGVRTENRTSERIVERLQEKFVTILENLKRAFNDFKLEFDFSDEENITSLTNSLTSAVAGTGKSFESVVKKLNAVEHGHSAQYVAQRAIEEVERLLQLEENNTRLEAVKRRLEYEINTLRAAKQGLEKNVEKTKDEAEKERRRYNELLALKIRQDTSNFQDLNDRGRPEAVVRKFQDIGNGVRLDAADELDDQYRMKGLDSLKVLCDIMKASWTQAKNVVGEINAGVMECITRNQALGDGLQMEIHHELKNADKDRFHKKIAEAVKEEFRKIYPDFATPGGEVECYVQECAQVAWMIVLTSPSMSLITEVKVPFDPKRHKLYSECRSKAGAEVTFVLWPGLIFDTNETAEEKPVVVTNTSELSVLTRSQEGRRSKAFPAAPSSRPPTEMAHVGEDQRRVNASRPAYSPPGETRPGQGRGDVPGRWESRT